MANPSSSTLDVLYPFFRIYFDIFGKTGYKMPRKQKKYHVIYKTTCKVNGKYYVGMHSTDNLDDGYVGSGKRLWYSINKYGKENFEVEFLEFFDSRKDLIDREIEMVNEDLLQDPLCMNLKTGGTGGFINEEHRLKCSTAGNIGYINKLKTDIHFKIKVSNTASNRNKKMWEDPEYRKYMMDHCSSTTTGKICINNNKINKFIFPSDLEKMINTGWKQGRLKASHSA